MNETQWPWQIGLPNGQVKEGKISLQDVCLHKCYNYNLVKLKCTPWHYSYHLNWNTSITI